MRTILLSRVPPVQGAAAGRDIRIGSVKGQGEKEKRKGTRGEAKGSEEMVP
jgi:hypothetical protein